MITPKDQPNYATSRLRPTLAMLAAAGIIVASCTMGTSAWGADAPVTDPTAVTDVAAAPADTAPADTAPVAPAPVASVAPAPEVAAPAPDEVVAPVPVEPVVSTPVVPVAPTPVLVPTIPQLIGFPFGPMAFVMAPLGFVSGPTISGDAIVGSTLTAAATFSGPTTDVTYQWFAGSTDPGSAIAGAVGATLLLTRDLGDKQIFVQITGTDAGTPAVGVSDPTDFVIVPDFESLSSPTISGTATVGSTLTATVGDYSLENDGVTYEWFQEQNQVLYPIDGATARTLKLTANELGTTVLVKIVAVLDGYEDVWTWSAPTAVVHATISSVLAPTLTGDLTVGSVLTVTPGTWSSPNATDTYDWGVSGGEFGDSLPDTGPTHTVTTADMGLTVVVNVTAHNGDEISDPIRLTTSTTIPFAVPTAPFTSDAGISAANQGSVTGTTAKNSATITVPSGNPGDHVYVYGFSTPTGLGWYVLDANKQIVVDYSSLPGGSHHLVVLNQAGAVVGWLAVAKADPAALRLASTGVSYDAAGVSGLAGLALLTGLSLLAAARVIRRKRELALV
ncbi:hypothetical protein [Lacisediminihabitans sp.]|uniref:hypothetical protein n=1 Tax=Lacisediminihabitans sp. TaxID=2787631 RepID=UPI00374DE40F